MVCSGNSQQCRANLWSGTGRKRRSEQFGFNTARLRNELAKHIRCSEIRNDCSKNRLMESSDFIMWNKNQEEASEEKRERRLSGLPGFHPLPRVNANPSGAGVSPVFHRRQVPPLQHLFGPINQQKGKNQTEMGSVHRKKQTLYFFHGDKKQEKEWNKFYLSNKNDLSIDKQISNIICVLIKTIIFQIMSSLFTFT